MKQLHWLIISGIFFIIMACGTARRDETVVKALAVETEIQQGGERVFMRFCNGCHPGGAAGLGPAINNKPLPGGMIKFQVRHGLGVMPAFKKETISEEDLDKLVAYLKVIRKNEVDNQSVVHN